VDEVEIVFLSDDSAIQAAVRTGEITMGVRPNTPNTIFLELIDEIPDATWTRFPDNVIGGTFVDLAIEPFSDVRVRQAMNVAIDRNAVLAVTESLNEGGAWGSSLPALAPWGIDGEDPNSTIFPFFGHDVQKARQLMDAAGFGDGVGPFNFAIPAANTYGTTFTESGLVIQANFAAIGVETDADIRDSTEHYSTTFRGTGNDGGIGITGSVQGIEPDELFRNMYIGDSPRSPIINGELLFDDARLTELIDAQLAAIGTPERLQLIQDLQLHLAEQMYMFPNVYAARTLYAAPEISGAAPKASFTQTATLEEVWFNNL
jgi:peptide/nickel transport system substrate-binding protein